MSTASSIAQLKASFHPITVLQLQQYDIEGFEDQLKAWVKETPHLFQGMPIILDVSCLTQQKEHLTVLIDKLRHYGVMPIGIQNAELDQQQLAKQMGLGVFTAKKKASAPSLSPGLTKQNKPIAPMMVEGVRSGQKIHAKGDLIVLGSVSAGAEVSAAGNIHVYGTLVGRALAGTQDNKKACLFCMNIQAELVAIAGYYWQYADLQAFASKSICIYLSDERLQARSLG